MKDRILNLQQLSSCAVDSNAGCSADGEAHVRAQGSGGFRRNSKKHREDGGGGDFRRALIGIHHPQSRKKLGNDHLLGGGGGGDAVPNRMLSGGAPTGARLSI